MSSNSFARVFCCCSQNKCSRYWPKTQNEKMYHNVPDTETTEGRIGVRLVSERKDKHFIVSEIELTREDVQVVVIILTFLQ